MKGIIGTKNAGFEIIKADTYNGTAGYCLGAKESEYVTWFFTKGTKEWNFSHGHYFQIDRESPVRSYAAAKADYHRRLADANESIAEYGM